MKHSFELPAQMKDMKLDDRGYPIPYFVPFIDGKPDFRYQDERKRQTCIDRKWCSICGKPLIDRSFWFISGPMGFQNKVATDAPMHEACARFSIQACPHLIFLKAERRSEEPIDPTPGLLRDKPKEIYLIKSDKYKVQIQDGNQYFRFRVATHEKYVYQDNKLVLYAHSRIP